MEVVIQLEKQNGVDTEKIKHTFHEIVTGRQTDGLFYYRILDQIKDKIGRNNQISQKNHSWIYYQLANLKKEKEIDKKFKTEKDSLI